MSSDNSYELFKRFPALEEHLPVYTLSRLPTELRRATLQNNGYQQSIWIKADDAPGRVYGGNKLRKLDFLFGRLAQRNVSRVATFGTVASNHALATAACTRWLDREPVCFLAHQTRTPLAARALRQHAALGTTLIPWPGNRQQRIELLRNTLWHKNASVIAMGGSSWTGSVGFVNAGLELAEQFADQFTTRQTPPARIYIASGTLGSAAGLALGLALAELPTEVHAIRVSPSSLCNRQVLQRLLVKIAAMLHRFDRRIRPDTYRRANVVLRHEQFGSGYAKPTSDTEQAVDVARREFGMELDATYTGKAFAALLADFNIDRVREGGQLFWNTYHPIPRDGDVRHGGIPSSFASYLDGE